MVKGRALTGLIAAAILVGVLAPAAATEVGQGLDPLTRQEIEVVRDVLTTSGRTSSASRFPLIVLDEPTKGEPADGPRRAKVIVYERAVNKTFEAIVDLSARRVLRWQHRPGVQPAILMEEYAMTAEIVRGDGRWRAALERRGIVDVENVYIDPWPVGRHPEARRSRVVGAVAYYRGQATNAYARPIEGLVAFVDLAAGVVTRVLDTGVVPVPTKPADLDEGSIGSQRVGLRPLQVVQPEGPSFERHGYLVQWQNWSFRFALHPREGLVLYTVRYQDGGRARSILHRGSLSELFVPYADRSPTWSFRQAFDQGEVDLGRYANSLERGTDAPGHATLVDAVLADDHGMAYEVPRAIALYERDGGLLWKHADYPKGNESRRARELVVSWIANQGNYEYGFNWIFHQDGVLEMEALLIGIVLPKGVKPGSGGDARATNGAHHVAPGLEAVRHQHWFSFRLDIDVDGLHNTVIEVDTVPGRMGGAGADAFEVRERTLRRESEARRRLDPTVSRMWKVVNPRVKNELGTAVGYALVPGENAWPVQAAAARRRAGFIEAHLWVTPYDPRHEYAAGEYVNQGEGRDGLPAWVKARRPIEDRDVVLWYTMGVTHLPRPEDWPVMSVSRAGFRLVPVGFFSRNPALDVPR